MVGPGLVATGALLDISVHTSTSTHRQPGAIKLATSGSYALSRSIAVASVIVAQQFGHFGGGADIRLPRQEL
jgi:hypothetical protein